MGESVSSFTYPEQFEPVQPTPETRPEMLTPTAEYAPPDDIISKEELARQKKDAKAQLREWAILYGQDLRGTVNLASTIQRALYINNSQLKAIPSAVEIGSRIIPTVLENGVSWQYETGNLCAWLKQCQIGVKETQHPDWFKQTTMFPIEHCFEAGDIQPGMISVALDFLAADLKSRAFKDKYGNGYNQVDPTVYEACSAICTTLARQVDAYVTDEEFPKEELLELLQEPLSAIGYQLS